MLFKHCTALSLDVHKFRPTLSQLEKALADVPARECQGVEREHIGVDEVAAGMSTQVMPADGQRAFFVRLRLDQRVLPKAAVKREIRKRLASFRREGIELSSADRRKLADDTEAQLLSSALQKEQHIQAIVDIGSGELWVDQSSPGKVDAAIKCLRRALGSLPGVMADGLIGEGFLKQWALEPMSLPGDLDLTGEIKLLSDDGDTKATTAAKGESLTGEQWQELIAERRVQELGVGNEQWCARVTASMTLKAIKAQSQQETGGDLAADIEVTIAMLREIRQWLDEGTSGALQPDFHGAAQHLPELDELESSA